MFALTQWGESLSERGPRRIFEHAGCGGRVDRTGRCGACGDVPRPQALQTRPGPGADPTVRDDAVSKALRAPHRLLEPLPTRG